VTILADFLLIATAVGVLYLALALIRVLFFAATPMHEVENRFAPSVTVLKPVAGLEPDLYQNLASFCDQDYPDYDIVFCLHDPDDPAREIVDRLNNEFPGHTRVAIGHNDAIANPKIANIAKPGVDLRGEIVVIADSDINVGRHYLRRVMAGFASENIGAVTCLYSGLPSESIVSRLGAMQIEDIFAPSVLVATLIGKLRFCLGATMAVRSDVLEQIGGLEALGSHLADDHVLGELVSAKGYDVELSRYVVKTTIPETNLSELWSHELRWARTHMAQAPGGYFLSFVMYAVPLAALYLAFTQDVAFAIFLLALVLIMRFSLHYVARSAFDIQHIDDDALIPIRDCMSLLVWFVSLFGRRVKWRAQTYKA
jgi:ceramide glucosyltransferase